MRNKLIINSLLTVLVLCLSFVLWLFDDVSYSKANIEAIVDMTRLVLWQRVMVIVTAAAFIFSTGTLAIRLAWNELAPKMFNANKITYGEAYTVCLLLTLMSEFL